MKNMKVAGQVLILWNDVKNELDISEYWRKNNKKYINLQMKYTQDNTFCRNITR